MRKREERYRLVNSIASTLMPWLLTVPQVRCKLLRKLNEGYIRALCNIFATFCELKIISN